VRRLPKSNAAGTEPSFLDQALQTGAGPLVPASSGLNFEGVSAFQPSPCCAPSDDNAAVGATQVVQWVNKEYEVFDKTTGASLAGPFHGSQIWTSLGGPCATYDSGDIIAQYDKLNNVWVLSQPVFTSPYYDCFAVSQTSDATGAYNLYAFPLPSNSTNFPDYPKTGIWPDGYYRTYNVFQGSTGPFLFGQVCAFDGAAMRAGNPATAQCFNGNNSGLTVNDGGLLPSDVDGTTSPPSGEPNLLLELDRTKANSHLDLWKFHVDFAVPSNSTFTGPTAIPVANYSLACGGLSCIPQPGSSQKLDSLGDRLMYRTAYRNFAADHEVILASHSVNSGGVVGVRWYEIRDPNGSPTIYQQGTYQPDDTYRWMGSMAMDKNQDIAVGYSASSLNLQPAIRYNGRLSGDPLGTLDSEDLIFQGSGSQNGGLDRWGDYTSMSVDPTDDCTFWYTDQYLPSDGSYNWHTRLFSFQFNGCTSAAGPDFTITASPASQSVVAGGFTTYTATVAPVNGFTGSVTLSVLGLPSGATGSFSPNSITGGSGSSTLTVNTSGSTPSGTYTLTIDGQSGSEIHSAFVNLSVGTPPSGVLFPSSVAFGNVVVNTTSKAHKFILSSNGGTPLVISSYTFTGPNAGDFAQSNNCPGSLNPSLSCNINVTFTPSTVGAESATLTVSDNGTNSPQTAPLSGTGVVPVNLGPASANFGSVPQGTTSSPRNFTLRNNQPTALTISSIGFTGTDAADFAVSSKTCGSTLAAKSTCSISVTFTPSNIRAESATLTVSENAPAPYNTVTSSLSGTGIAQASVSPTSLTFGSQKTGTTSAPKTVTLTNNLSSALSFVTSFTGADPTDFAATDNCSESVPAKSKCTLSVTFTPGAVGSRSATLNVTDSANNSPQQVSLSGTGK